MRGPDTIELNDDLENDLVVVDEVINDGWYIEKERRHNENLSVFTGWWNGIYYENGIELKRKRKR